MTYTASSTNSTCINWGHLHICSSPEPKAQVSYSDHVPSVVRHLSVVRPSICKLFPLNNFFSKTTKLIWTKLGRKHLWEMGIQVCENHGAGTCWGPI